ncbi:MAG: chromosomal replication initiator protein DnaA [Deltaproteobacteria bacterium]|nr:MAG: chromosomal replication initiator protein DnaA [Deltaproteobacteria bacterium]
MSKKKDIWEQITKTLESQLSKSEFKTWFSQATLRKSSPDLAIIGVPNKFVAHWLREKYYIQIRDAFQAILNRPPELHFIYDHPADTVESPDAEPSQKREVYGDPRLDPSMTFGRLHMGECNRFACSSALEVANKPAEQYNPFYIYSDLSLGKTHLLNAIGNHVLNKNPYSHVRYLTSNTFTSDFTYSIKNKNLQAFRERYCGLDLLLLDDVQLLGNRKKTQEELLFIFNALYGAGKQIVISGDSPPNQLPRMNARLKSRLGSGLISEIEVPDQSTKIHIIRKKAKEDGIAIPDDVIFFLAKSNRDFKGLVKNIVRIETYASLNRGDLNISTVKSLIKDDQRKEAGMEDVKSITAGYFNISLSELISNKKQRIYSYPRQVAMYLCRKYTDSSFKQIGDAFGNKDHSTVIYAVNRIEKYKARKKETREDLNKLEDLLG